MKIYNPVLPGFNPDPCICRRGDDYYIAVSTFEWMPGIPVYHSRDLVHWELFTHVLTDRRVDLKNLPSAKGIWAPCLTYCEDEDQFYVLYGVMNSMNARCFDIDNYLITAKDITGPWSEPVYLHSAGFDASILHDTDGRKYIVSLEWETRDGYEKPGAVCLMEYDPAEKTVVGYPKRIWNGGTDRGCIEGPHLTKHDGRYYLMCAEGGTGYYHCVTMARSDTPWGPYERDPENPILTSSPENHNERADWDHLKPHYYNPESPLQKSGHGSYVQLHDGSVYLAHLTARPFITEDPDPRRRYRCTLGRETALQKMYWTEDGWLRLAAGGNLAQTETEAPDLPPWQPAPAPARDDFDSDTLTPGYYAPRILPESFTDLSSRPGYLRIQGQESQSSLHQTSILAQKLTGVYADITTKMDFHPKVYQHSAGLILYYDNENYIYLRKYFSDTLKKAALGITSVENDVRKEWNESRTPAGEGEVYLRLVIRSRSCRFSWSSDGEHYNEIGPVFDTSCFSDEYSRFGEFTGTMAGITCADTLFHRQTADFDFFEIRSHTRITYGFNDIE